MTRILASIALLLATSHPASWAQVESTDLAPPAGPSTDSPPQAAPTTQSTDPEPSKSPETPPSAAPQSQTDDAGAYTPVAAFWFILPES